MLKRLNWTANEIIIEQAIQSYPKENERIILNRPTGNFFYDKWELNTEFIGTAWEKILASFPKEIGEARVIKLIPGETYMAHADIDDRWHLNLTGDRCYLIDLDTEHMHLLIQDRHWYEMDTGKIHVASNFGSVDRLQIVIRKLLTQTTEVDLVSVTITPNGYQHDYRYKFDQIISPYLNRANKKSMLKDFKVNKEVVSFKLARCELSNFKNSITENFNVTYDITQ
jgi:hypothetical protein